jgi:hypothetical protein
MGPDPVGVVHADSERVNVLTIVVGNHSYDLKMSTQMTSVDTAEIARVIRQAEALVKEDLLDSFRQALERAIEDEPTPAGSPLPLHPRVSDAGPWDFLEDEVPMPRRSRLGTAWDRFVGR